MSRSGKKSFVTLLGVLATIAGCALPPPERQYQELVSEREIETVSFAREGLNYVKRSRFLDAELKFRQALMLAPDSDRLKLNLAVVLDRQNQFDEAEALYRDLLDRYPKSIEYLSGLAHLYLSQEQFDRAAEQYEKALVVALDENRTEQAVIAARSLGVLRFTEGREEDAFCWSDLATTLKPSAEEVYRHSRILLGTGRIDPIFGLVEPLVSEGSHDARLLTVLAFANFELGAFEKAKFLLEPVLEQRNLAPTISYETGLLDIVLKRELKLQEQAQSETEPESEEEDAEESEADEEQEDLLLGSNPLSNPQSVYWPPSFLEALDRAVEEYELEESKKRKGFLWF